MGGTLKPLTKYKGLHRIRRIMHLASLLLFFAWCMHCNNACADTHAVIVNGPKPMARDYQYGKHCNGANLYTGIPIDTCEPNPTAVKTGVVWTYTNYSDSYYYMGFSMLAKPKHTMDFGVFIPPVSGDYVLAAAVCETESATRCSLSDSVDIVQSTKHIPMVKNKPLGRVDAGLPDRFVQYGIGISWCYVFVNNGKYYSNKTGIMCQDANPTPDVPVSCQLDGGNALDVSMGTIQKGEIPLFSDARPIVSKNLGVTCTGDSELDTVTTFKYTSLDDVASAVATNVRGLGVAIQYNGTPIAAGKELPGTFTAGTNSIKLDFAPVRSSTVASSDIVTGDFTGDIVMVITLQ